MTAHPNPEPLDELQALAALLALVCGIGVILTAPYFVWMASSVRF